jgi:hypothetical protein
MLKTILQKSQKVVGELKYQTRLLKNNGNLPALDVNDSYIVDALVNEGVYVTSLALFCHSDGSIMIENAPNPVAVYG